MSGDESHHIIETLNDTNKKTNETVKAEEMRVNPSGATSSRAGKLPAEKDPAIDQYQANAQQEEPQRRLQRSG